MKPVEGRRRVVIENVQPQIEGGRYAIKRSVGEALRVQATMFCDNEEQVAGRLLYRHASERRWQSIALLHQGQDEWSADFVLDRPGNWHYTVQGWADAFRSWCTRLEELLLGQEDAGYSPEGSVIPRELRRGATLIEELAARASTADAKLMMQIELLLRWMADQNAAFYENPVCNELVTLAAKYPNLELATRYPQEILVWADRPRARFSTQYQIASQPQPFASAPSLTLSAIRELLPVLAQTGFDVLCLSLNPWDIRAADSESAGPVLAITQEFGTLTHKVVDPSLGTLWEFGALVKATNEFGLELAVSLDFRCGPNHPWVKEHRDWFESDRHPADKDDQVFFLDFESKDWRAMWEALNDVFSFWIRHGVRIFQLERPDRFALPFWEWCLQEVHGAHPDVIFVGDCSIGSPMALAVAKTGFSQLRTPLKLYATATELRLAWGDRYAGARGEFMRGSLWLNWSPQASQEDRATSLLRLILAATLGATYGIVDDLQPVSVDEAGSPTAFREHATLLPVVARINQIRRDNLALQHERNLHFHTADNPRILCFSKSYAENRMLVAANLDTMQEQAGWIELDLQHLAIGQDDSFDVEDLLTGAHYAWSGRSNYVALRPQEIPAHIFRVTRSATSEATLDLDPHRTERDA